MLTVYRRHVERCKHKADRISKKCRCPLWAKGTVEGSQYQKSLKTRSFERAEQIKKEIENGKRQEDGQEVTVEAALKVFVADCESRNLNEKTLRKYRQLDKALGCYADRHGIRGIVGFSASEVRDFRSSRKIGARTAAKELERIRAFFRFCAEQGWIEKSPAQGIKPPQVRTLPRLPFDECQVRSIVSKTASDRELAFMLTLRHTGLRIGDASLLRQSQFDGERVHLYTTKAGTPVSIKIPPKLALLLKKLPTTGGYFFLWGESTHQHSVSNLWRRRFKAICKECEIMPDHPHRMRHSLAADLLMKGASVEDVAAILGNSPAVVIKHYSQWIKGRQDRLDSFMESTWRKPALKLVKK